MLWDFHKWKNWKKQNCWCWQLSLGQIPPNRDNETRDPIHSIWGGCGKSMDLLLLPCVSLSNPKTLPSFRFFPCKIMILITILQFFFVRKKENYVDLGVKIISYISLSMVAYIFLMLRFKKYPKRKVIWILYKYT